METNDDQLSDVAHMLRELQETQSRMVAAFETLSDRLTAQPSPLHGPAQTGPVDSIVEHQQDQANPPASQHKAAPSLVGDASTQLSSPVSPSPRHGSTARIILT